MHARKYTDADALRPTAARIPDVDQGTQVFAVKRAEAGAMIRCGQTTVYQLCVAGLLDTIMVGKEQRITIESIRRFVERGGCPKDWPAPYLAAVKARKEAKGEPSKRALHLQRVRDARRGSTG